MEPTTRETRGAIDKLGVSMRGRIGTLLNALIIAAALAGIALLLSWADGSPAIFYAFTVQSNLLLAGFAAWQLRRPQRPEWLHGALTLYIAITGLVYNLVLANPASGFSLNLGGDWRFEASNTLLHTATPLLALVTWLIAPRAAQPVRWTHALLWLAYPLAYLVFSLLRYGLTGRSLYPFLDVSKLGYGGVAATAAVLTVVFYLLGLALVGLRKLALRSA